MTLDEIFDELDGIPDTIASSISMGINQFSNLKERHITPTLLYELAKEVSGFNKVPKNYLNDDLIGKGIFLLLSQSDEPPLAGTPTEKYEQAAIHGLSNNKLYLGTVHPELITKSMLLTAIANKTIGPDRELLTNNHISKLIDDEVGAISIQHKLDFVFKHQGGSNISDELWIKAINDEPGVSKYLVGKQRDDLLKGLIENGFWPENFLGSKPVDLPASVSKLAKNAVKDEYQALMVKALILTYPIEEVLPLFKTPARKKILGSLYSIEELRPHMKAFPFIKAAVLEESLGL